jgi:hypothetical protein
MTAGRLAKWGCLILALVFSSQCGPPAPTQNIPADLTAVPRLYTNRCYVATNGDDNNPGTLAQPWQTIQKAVKTVVAGDTIYVRGGQYNGIKNGWVFQNSGTQAQPIPLTNSPGEQVVFKHTTVTNVDHEIFRCSINPRDPPSWQTPKADYIRIIGTDVMPHLLSNGVESRKGIVIQGLEGEQSYDINVADCDYWEVAGVDFVETAGGIRTWKNKYQMEEHSTDDWYVHDNRVYNFYRESGMQFNGNNNRIENNEIYKGSNQLYTPYGCQMLNFLGHGNIIRGNVLSRKGSTAICGGILFEWDLADRNTVEQNLIFDVPAGISFQGGDNNLIRDNIIYRAGTPEPYRAGIEINSYDNQTTWPCNDVTVNDPADPDYQYYYNPRNCHSFGNQIYNNTIHGFTAGIYFSPLVGENTVIRNNALSGWTQGSICYNGSDDATCRLLPADLMADHNATQEPFGFVDIQHFDFHLTANSPLIDAGYNLGSLNPNDYDGNSRPQGQGFDIGAYEYLPFNLGPFPH